MGAAAAGPKEKAPRVERGEGLEAVERVGNKPSELGMLDLISSA